MNNKFLKIFYAAFMAIILVCVVLLAVQDIRLGATIQRTISCRRRLLDYANGKIDSIPELDEKLLPYRTFEKRSIYCNEAKYYLTTNSLSFLT